MRVLTAGESFLSPVTAPSSGLGQCWGSSGVCSEDSSEFEAVGLPSKEAAEETGVDPMFQALTLGRGAGVRLTFSFIEGTSS